MSEQEQYRKIAKNTAVVGGAQLVQMGVTLVRAKIIAILLGPLGAGVNSLLLSALMVMQQVSSVGVFQSGVREMSTIEDPSKRAKFRKVFLKLAFQCSLLGVLVMVLFSPLLSLVLFDDWSYTWWLMLVAITLVFMGLHSGYSTVMQATQNLSLMAKATMVGAVIGLVGAVLCFYFLSLSGIVPAIIWGYFAFWLSFRYFEKKISFEQVEEPTKQEFIDTSKPVVKLGVVLMASAVLITLFNLLLNSFISNFGSIKDVGFYQSAASIITQGMIISNIVLSSDFFPRLSASQNNSIEFKSIINKQIYILVYLVAPISAILIVFAPVIVRILLSPEFAIVERLIQIMSTAIVCRVIWMIFGYTILAKGDKRTYFIFDALLGNGLNFLVSVIGFYYWGLEGLSIAFLCGSLFMAIFLGIMIKIKYDVEINKSRIMLIVFSTLTILTIALFSLLSEGIVKIAVQYSSLLLVICSCAFQLNKKMRILEIAKNRLKR